MESGHFIYILDNASTNVRGTTWLRLRQRKFGTSIVVDCYAYQSCKGMDSEADIGVNRMRA